MHTAVLEATDTIDRWGRPAWIALMILGFVLFWPVGLAILVFLLWSGRMGCSRNGSWRRGEMFRAWGPRAGSGGGTGNAAFDEYRDATLKRLEEDAKEFRSFLERLRFAKDKEEFDRFMADRSRPEPASPAA